MERSLHANLKTALLNNDEFTYAHLVKFERPTLVLNPHTGKASSDGKYFTYLTDSSVNISFNDGSYKDDGTTANGLDGTAATSQGVYMFFLNKQTLIMDGSGISVQK